MGLHHPLAALHHDRSTGRTLNRARQWLCSIEYPLWNEVRTDLQRLKILLRRERRPRLDAVIPVSLSLGSAHETEKIVR